ncbi:Protein transport protein sec16 [Pleurostoma richardsiae]|uniref:Protein transport protein sec16 n=1 Tax=Pleurostoma richardsiae TaxID=41990 RepID=A0AA38R0Y3_9PEZI|nr:Protein transport protein sec16 [Pleurostoma richardsiae]
MASDAPTAAWHPALMPNSAATASQSRSKSESESKSKSTSSSTLGTPETTISPEAVDDVQDHELSAPHDEIVEDDSHIPAQDQGESHDTDALADGSENGTESPARSQADADDTPDAAENTAKHMSTMSFARTVSHDVNWTDDEDSEWNLSRADTDPFKFMPPNDRTNSFPPVPAATKPADQAVPQPLPSNQAGEVVSEVEHQTEHVDPEANHVASELQQDIFWGDDDPEEAFPVEGFVGGDVQGSQEAAADARYSEGLPLVHHEKGVDMPTLEDNATHDPFATSPGNDGDDFFDHIGDANGSGPHAFPDHQSLERKSTMQVLESMNTSAGTMLDATPEEDEVGDIPTTSETEGPQDGLAHGEADNADGQKGEGGDLVEKWKEAFAEDDDEDFLLDESAEDNIEGKAMDPAAFFGDDDEGFLDDVEESHQGTQPIPAGEPSSKGANGRYLPPGATQASAGLPSVPYLPNASPAIVQPPVPTPFAATPPVASPFQPSASVPPVSSALGYGSAPSRPEPVKAQSFVDKSKGGYHSPYDLPMDVVKPRKRASMQHIPRSPATSAPPQAPPAPPRSSSMYSQPPPSSHPPPSRESIPSLSPPSSSHSNQGPSLVEKPPLRKSSSSFFEELPIMSKPRPASRHSHQSLPSPSQASPHGPPPMSHPQAPPYTPPPSQDLHLPELSQSTGVPKLVAPERLDPYASLQSGPSMPHIPPAASSRYSPAPPTLPNGAVPVPSTSRYSPAPPNQRVPSVYAAAPAPAAPPILPHQPRTSSPLAHFEITRDGTRPSLSGHTDSGLSERRSSSSHYEPRLTRVPSLPPTREVEEVEAPAFSPPLASDAPPQTMYSHEPRHAQPPRQTPPPVSAGPYSMQSTLSPPKRTTSSYIPQSQPASSPLGHEFAPPPRSHTQSPGTLYGHRGPVAPADPVPRPSSVHDATSPRSAAHVPAQSMVSAVSSRPRGFSQNLNVIPPTDGSEKDPLQRWRGAPLISWGVGGTIVTSFPKDVPRYGVNQALPMVVRSPGEVRIKNVKDIQPLEERLAKFPGPLKGKSKKKETIAWLTTGIEGLERSLPNPTFHSNISHDDKRAVERLLLWKILRLFIEYDGALEGSAAVQKAVRDVLSPGVDGMKPISEPLYSASTIKGLQEPAATQVQADAVDSSTVEQLKKLLMGGDREEAVWAAADKRLWGHALLIANTVSPELYQKVSQEFIKKDVNFPGHNNESLAALYEVLSGNHEESVDELVPVHARAGLQMMATSSISGPAKGALDGLDKWRETLNLILSNRSVEDARAITSLGNLLSEYGRAEAAHICFLFARSTTVFGGLDDPQSNFVLVGSDHRRQAQQFEKETEALLLSEVYEYGLSLGGTSNAASSSPHLAAYKLQHAMTLAEYGYRDKALQYCEAILTAINSQTRRSQYHHGILESAVEDFMKRLKQAPKEESNSWIPKPSMNKVSDSVWNRFNKFVAGDENESSGQGSPTGGDESGPFGRIAGGTPTISRPPSTSNAMDMFGNANGYAPGGMPPASAPPIPLNRTASRYAPMAGQPAAASSPYEPSSAYMPAGRPSVERTSGEHSRSSQELRRQSSDFQPGYANGHALNPMASPTHSPPDAGPGLRRESSYVPQTQPEMPPPSQTAPPAGNAHPGYSPYAPQEASINASPYAPAGPHVEKQPQSVQSDPIQNTGYQPPSYGYEPPSVNLVEESATQTEDNVTSSGYEAPSYQPYGYEPPSYEPDTNNDDGDSGSEAKPKKSSFMDDDEDDVPALQSGEKSKEEKDRENAELFRKAAEEDAKREAAEKEAKAKKGWGFGGWFGGGKKDNQEPAGNKPIKANLGEASSFYYDPDQKRWVNKKGGAEESGPKKAAPPPPRATPRSAAGTPPPSAAARLIGGPEAGRASAPPPPRSSLSPPPSEIPSGPPSNLSAPPPMLRSVSNTSSGPPSRPTTSMSNASSIDDLLGAPGPRKAGGKKAKKGGRYVDVMAK